MEGIWQDFKDARSSDDLERMRFCLKELELEMNTSVMVNGQIQKHKSRQAVMVKSIQRKGLFLSRQAFEDEGTW